MQSPQVIPKMWAQKPDSSMSRREWMRSSGILASAAFASSILPIKAADTASSKPFKLDLTVWKLGISGNQDDAIQWAKQFGFASVGAHTDEVSRWSEADHEKYKEVLL